MPSTQKFEDVLSAIHAEGLRVHMLIEIDSENNNHYEKWRCLLVKRCENGAGWKGSSTEDAASAMFDALEGYRNGNECVPLPLGTKEDAKSDQNTTQFDYLPKHGEGDGQSGEQSRGPGRPRKDETPKTTRVKGKNAENLRDELLRDAEAGRIPDDTQVQRLPEKHKKVVQQAIEAAKKDQGTNPDVGDTLGGDDGDLSDILGDGPAESSNDGDGESLDDVLGSAPTESGGSTDEDEGESSLDDILGDGPAESGGDSEEESVEDIL